MNEEERTKVAIVGAGVAGLCCARVLTDAGIPCLLFEASDRVGGRVRTDTVKGFLLDRGFQVLLTAYPEARRWLDYERLDLRTFYPGALVRVGDEFHRMADPWRKPLDAASAFSSPIGNWADKLRVGQLRHKLAGKDPERLLERPETTTMAALRVAGFSDEMIDRFFRPFFGGILLDDSLTASSRMFDYTFRMFAAGAAAVPAQGMGKIPEQLAYPLAESTIRLNRAVDRVEPGQVILDGGDAVGADIVVIATDAASAHGLVDDVATLAWRGVTCMYFSSSAAPVREPILVLNGTGEGPVNNVAVMSEVSAAYAPNRRSLISVTVLGDPDDPDEALEDRVRAQLGRWFGTEVEGWEHLRTYRIPQALPDQDPPALADVHQPAQLAERLFVCGDHRDMRSLQGAMASGRRAGEAIAGLVTG